MTGRAVKEKIGIENWETFIAWMKGQTLGIYPDGSTNYYECDVEAFITKLKTGYDRQNNPLTWD